MNNKIGSSQIKNKGIKGGKMIIRVYKIQHAHVRTLKCKYSALPAAIKGSRSSCRLIVALLVGGGVLGDVVCWGNKTNNE